MYKMITIFSDGTKETTTYKTKQAAEQARKNYYMVFGCQISLIYIEKA